MKDLSKFFCPQIVQSDENIIENMSSDECSRCQIKLNKNKINKRTNCEFSYSMIIIWYIVAIYLLNIRASEQKPINMCHILMVLLCPQLFVMFYIIDKYLLIPIEFKI